MAHPPPVWDAAAAVATALPGQITNGGTSAGGAVNQGKAKQCWATNEVAGEGPRWAAFILSLIAAGGGRGAEVTKCLDLLYSSGYFTYPYWSIDYFLLLLPKVYIYTQGWQKQVCCLLSSLLLCRSIQKWLHFHLEILQLSASLTFTTLNSYPVENTSNIVAKSALILHINQIYFRTSTSLL